MTTLAKRAFAGLAVLAGAAAVISEGAWRSRDERLGRNLDRASTRSELGPREASRELAFLTEPFVSQEARAAAKAVRPAAPPNDFWSFRPARDTFRADALLDLRKLNETTAGQSGFVGLSPDKNSFVRGDGEPIRFWSVNFDPAADLSPADLAHTARFLAKRGVNLVRVLENVGSRAKTLRLTDADSKTIDRIWRVAAAMKKEGIYLLITPCWPGAIKSGPRRLERRRLARESAAARAFFLQSDASDGIQGLAESAARAEEPLHRSSLGSGPGARLHPAP